MKFFFTFLFFLSLISTIYCNYVDAIEERACKNQKKDYEDCIDALYDINTKYDYKTLCSKKCKKFFNDPVKALPKCFQGDITDEQKESLDMMKKVVNTSCATDGGGNNCPNTQALIDNKFTKTREQAEDIANRTCKSKYCTDALIEIHKALVGTDTYSEEMLNKLNSKECRDQNSVNSLNIGNSLILTFALFFILLF